MAVRSVKVYRVIHQIANAKEIAEGWNPYDAMTYAPYYEGEYNPDGTPKKPPRMEFLPEEVRFLRHWVYEETHHQEGPAKHLQLLHRVVSDDLAVLIGAAFPDPAEQQSAGIGPPPTEPPVWPWSDRDFQVRLEVAPTTACRIHSCIGSFQLSLTPSSRKNKHSPRALNRGMDPRKARESITSSSTRESETRGSFHERTGR